MPATPRLMIAVNALPPAVLARAAAAFEVIDASAAIATADDLHAALADAGAVDALLIGSQLRLRGETVIRLPAALRVVATVSVGFDHLDIAAFAARGLAVTNTPDVLTGCTADLAFLLLLAAARRAHEANHLVASGDWTSPLGLSGLLGTRVHGKRLGILGLGRIGQAVAERARGFGMRVIYHDVARREAPQEKGATYYTVFEDMLARCDFLSLHAPALPGTIGIVDARRLALLPRGAIIVNAARGDLIVEEDLIAALDRGHVAGAGLDVFAREPNPNPRLAAHPRVFATPHVGSGTRETRDAMGFRALDNIAAVLAGRPPIDPLW